MKKCVNGAYIEMTSEEIVELQSMQMEQPHTEPTPEERIAALEDAILELAEVICGG